MKNLFSFSFIILIIVALFVSILDSASNIDYSSYNISDQDIYVSSKGFTWPLPNKYYISSPFGYRDLNLYGASSYHSGIDIPGPEGTYFLSSIAGTISYTGFSGSGGYTIILENEDIKVIYCHVSSNFIVNVGDHIEQSQVIGQIGPLNVYGILNNPYKDKNGNPTNGSTSGCHLHFSIKINGTAVDPLDYL